MFSNEKTLIETLSKREKEVLKLIALEHTTQEIADTLFLSKHTIESYRKNLISKLEVRNLAGLTKYAIKLGLVDN
jgi:DNA-binding CsgD family transcriptional regulator